VKVGDLVRNIYTNGDAHIITGVEHGTGYYEIDGRWMVPEEHLEVISAGR